MINISDHTLFDKDGILIEYDGDKDIFFTESEAEKLRNFLNERRTYLRNRILDALKVKEMTLGELSSNLNVNGDIVNRELLMLEFNNKMCVEDKEVDDPHLGIIYVPIYKRKE